SGNYTVTLTTANNFGVDTMQKAAYIAVGPVFCATSITEHNFSNQINVYPNPASTSFHINFAQPFTGKLSVITIAGNSVLSKEVNMVNHALIQIEQLSAGMYLLRLENQKGYVAFKKLNVAKY